MDIEKLKTALAPWLKIDTWHTSHPLDEKRFNVALKTAFDNLGTSIAFDDFKDAMEQLAQEHHPTILATYREEFIEKLAQQAEIIGSYLHDNSI